MPTSDDLLTGKISISEFLGTTQKSPSDPVSTTPSVSTISPLEVDPNLLAKPIEGGSRKVGGENIPIEPDDTTLAGLAGAATRGVGPTATSALVGLGLAPFTGGASVPATVAAAAAAPTIGDMGVNAINRLLNTNFTTPTESFQYLFTLLGVPKPKTAAEKIVESATKAVAESVATSGLAGAAAPMMRPGVARTIVQGLSEMPIQQATAAGAGAGAAEMAKQTGSSELTQTGAGLVGALAGGALTGVKITPPAIGPSSAIQTAKRFNLEPMTSDIIPPTGMFGKFGQRVRESIPLTGTASILQKQQEAKQQAAKGMLLGFGVDLDNPAIEKVTTDLINNRKSDLIKYKKMQREAMDSAAASGAPTVATPKAEAAVKNAIKMLSGNSTTTKAIPVLEDILKDLSGFKNIDNVEMIRESLRDKFNDAALSDVKTIGQKVINSLYKPLKEDMENFISKYGNNRDITKFRIANRRLYDMAEEVGRKSLRMALNLGDIEPEVASNMLFSMKRSDVKSLYNALTPAGRAAARAAVMEKAWSEMIKNNAKINPDRFAKELKKRSNAIGIFFKDDDLNAAKGFIESIELLQRSGFYDTMPPTGIVGQVPLIGGSLATLFSGLLKGREGIIGTASAILGTGLIGRIYESPAVRDILIKLPKLKYDQKMDAVQRLIPAMHAVPIEQESK